MRRIRLLLCVACLLTACGTVVAAPGGSSAAMAGILEGQAVVLRGTQRLALVEGSTLQADDIVETAPEAFVQIEWPDGTMLGVGGGTRLMLWPRGLGRSAPRAYVLEGWFKVSGARTPAGVEAIVSPLAEAAGQGAVWVGRAERGALGVFVESGSLRLQERASPHTVATLKANEFGALRSGAKPATQPRPPADFIERMPRPFRDVLPARAARFADHKIASKPLGEVAYEDVSAWLHAEPAVRQPLLPRWRARATDRAFRAAVQANLAAHPEWEPVVYPERFVRRPADPAPAEAASAR